MPAPLASQQQQEVWFPDTSTLVTLAYHPPLGDEVRAYLNDKRVVLLEVVVNELHSLASSTSNVAGYANQALGDLHWAGESVPIKDTDIIRARVLQEEIRALKPLKYDLEHWGESAIIALASLAQHFSPVMLCEDYNARVAANRNGIKTYSVHKLLSRMLKENKISLSEAISHTDALCSHARGPSITARELTQGELGRVGRP